MNRTVGLDGTTTVMSATDWHRVLELVKSVKFGSVTLIIQDGHLIQLDRKIKLRLKHTVPQLVDQED